MKKKKKRKNRQNKEIIIPLDEFIHTLRISPQQLDEWIHLGIVHTYPHSRGYGVKYSDFKNIANSTIALNAALEAFKYETKRRYADEIDGNADTFLKSIDHNISLLKRRIDVLEDIHRSYHNKFDVLRSQDGVTAAYIIFSKIFRLLRMTFLCLENHYWETMTLIRPINEAADLAKYFIIEKDSEQGRKHILEWFRENKSPAHSVIRSSIETYAAKYLPKGINFLFPGLMGQLYHTTSKPIHIAHHNIMEIYIAEVDDNDTLKGVGFDYASCSYPRKINDLVEYIPSVCLAVVNSFIICFHIAHPLINSDDAKHLESLQKQFISQM
jgi:hypothetical protein